MENNNITNDNPWKGLNFYEEGEILYGRDEEIQSLSLHILSNTQTVVYGKSGIGKSSIIYAGVFPIAREQGFCPIPIRLSHESEQSYIEQIRNAFTKQEAKNKIGIKEVVPVIDSNKESIWEYLHRNTFYHPLYETPIRPLIVFDQFEEIFTLQKNEKSRREFFAQLADVLNDIVPNYILDSQKNQTIAALANPDQPFKLNFGRSQNSESRYIKEANFNIVFVIREDFLSYLERYTRYIPIMKNNRYALLPLNEEQAADIITKPRKGLVNLDVAKMIIEKVTESSDVQLDGHPEIEVSAAVLSLYLSRIYNKKGDSPIITEDMVSQYSENIIRDFYEESIADIPQEDVEKLENLLLTYNGRRDSMTLNDLIREGIPRDEIYLLSEKRKILRIFKYQNDDRVEYMHDVLCKVIVERIEQRELKAAHNREQELKRRTRIMKMSIFALVAFVIGLSFCIWDYFFRDIDKRYGIVVKEYGWYKGLDPISKDEASYRTSHYVLKYQGRKAYRKNHPYAMEVRNGFDRLCTEHDVMPYILNKYDYTDTLANQEMVEKINTVCKWEFLADESKDFLLQVRALDSDNKLVYSYNRSKTHEKDKVIGTYTDELGFPILMRGSSYCYLLITYDERGYETHMAYYDDQGYPMPNKDGAYQTRWEYCTNGIPKAELSCFLDGHLMIDRSGNCGCINTQFDNSYSNDSLYSTEIVSVDVNRDPCWMIVNDSFVVIRHEYDKHRRLVKESYWNEYNRPEYSKFGYHAVCYEYDDYAHGQITRQYFLDSQNKPCANIYGQYEIKDEYDAYGRITHEWRIKSKEIINEVWEYMDEDSYVKYEHFSVSTNSEKIDTVYSPSDYPNVYSRYYYDVMKKEEIIVYDDDNIKLKRVYDNQNRCIYSASFTIDDKPIPYIKEEDVQCYASKTNYDYRGDSTIIIKYFLNEDSKVYGYSKTIVDSACLTKKYGRFLQDDSWVDGSMYIYADSTFSKVIAQGSLNQSFKHIRSFINNNEIYYIANYIYNIRPDKSKNHIGWSAENEFGEPSLLFDTMYNCTHAKYYYNSEMLYFDDKGKRIYPETVKYPIVAYVELRPNRNTYGFKDGDIILACNNDMVLSSGGGYYNWDSSSDITRDRDFLLARHNATSNAYDTVHVIVAKGADLHYSLSINELYCTETELQRLYDMVPQNNKSNTIVLCCYNMVNNNTATAAGISNGSIILEFNEWNIHRNIDDIWSALKKANHRHLKLVYVDSDSQEIMSLETNDNITGQIAPRALSAEEINSIVIRYDKWKNHGKQGL